MTIKKFKGKKPGRGPRWRAGDRVKVIASPYGTYGHVGTIERFTTEGRTVLVHVLVDGHHETRPYPKTVLRWIRRPERGEHGG
jgi:hypothetical protein